jgi:hypothetical protein
MNYANRVRTLLLDEAEQATYSPLLLVNVTGDTYGPMSTYEVENPTLPADVRRIPPAPIPPGLAAMGDQQMEDARGTLSYPKTRQGDPGHSNPASAAFIDASQGQRTSLIRFLERAVAEFRKRQTRIDFAWDRTPDLDYKKPLLSPAGNRKDYTPGSDIPEFIRLEMFHGYLSGIDVNNKTVRILQLQNGGLMSRETAVANLDPMAGADYRAELDRIERDKVKDAFFQTGLAQAVQNGLDLSKVLVAMNDGADFMTALAAVMAEQQAQQQAMQAAQQGAMPQGALPPGAPNEPGMQNLQMQKGAIPGQTPGVGGPGIPQQVQVPPLENIMVRGVANG